MPAVCVRYGESPAERAVTNVLLLAAMHGYCTAERARKARVPRELQGNLTQSTHEDVFEVSSNRSFECVPGSLSQPALAEDAQPMSPPVSLLC